MTLSGPDSSSLFLPHPVWPCLTMSDSPCLILSPHLCFCLTLFDHVSPCLTQTHHVWSCLLIFVSVSPCLTMSPHVWSTDLTSPCLTHWPNLTLSDPVSLWLIPRASGTGCGSHGDLPWAASDGQEFGTGWPGAQISSQVGEGHVHLQFSLCLSLYLSFFVCLSVSLSLSLHSSLVLASRQKHQHKPLTLKLTLGKNPVEQVLEHHVLGIVIDDDLKRQSHMGSIW